jgi:ATPase family associated with various cellular activities (AAA)
VIEMTNTSENPFASERLERLPFRFPEGDSWDACLSRLAAQRWRGAIVGPPGSGKTTLLEQLVPHLEAKGFQPKIFTFRPEHTLAEKQATLSQIPGLRAPDFLLVDGADQLPTRNWLSVTTAGAMCAGLVITQHRGGRLPTVHACEPNAALLDALVVELTEAWLPEGEASRLLARYYGNVRECFRDLHDRYAG